MALEKLDVMDSLHEIINDSKSDDGDDETDDVTAGSTSWVRRSTRSLQPIETTNTAAAAPASTTLNNQQAATNAANATTNETAKETPKKRQYKNKRMNPDRDNVQLFAFDLSKENNELGAGGGRPKRKLKAIARFDSQSFNNRGSNCKTGHGFPCPRCSNTCSYDSRECEECGLECYYEAGVGVVVLKARNDIVSLTPRKRNRERNEQEVVNPTASQRNGKKKTTAAGEAKRQRRASEAPPKKAAADQSKKTKMDVGSNNDGRRASASAATSRKRAKSLPRPVVTTTNGGNNDAAATDSGATNNNLPQPSPLRRTSIAAAMPGKGKRLLPMRRNNAAAKTGATTRGRSPPRLPTRGRNSIAGRSSTGGGKMMITTTAAGATSDGVANDTSDDDDSQNDNSMDTDDLMTEETTTTAAAAANATKAASASSAPARQGVARPVVALYERRPFILTEYVSLDDARKDLGTSSKTIREKRNYNQEHIHPRTRTKGKFLYYDFRDINDVRTARRWQRELLAVQHSDFDGCDNLHEARVRPSWPVHLAEAHYRLAMGRRILKFMRTDNYEDEEEEDGGGGEEEEEEEDGGGGEEEDDSAVMSQQRQQWEGDVQVPALPPLMPTGGGGKIGQHVSFASDILANGLPPHAIKKSAYEEMESAEEEGGDGDEEDEDEAAKNAIVAVIRGRASSSTASHHHHSDNEHSAGLDGTGSVGASSLGGAGSLGDLSHFGRLHRSESEENDMVNQLNVDFPPEDHPLGIASDMETEGEDLAAKLQETTQTLQSVTEERKDLQAKYDSLLANSIKTEEDLRGTISTLMGTIRERGGGGSTPSSNQLVSELENRLSTVAAERDALAQKVNAMATVQLERDELARKLEEANTNLKARGSEEGVEEGKRVNARLEKEKEELVTKASRLEDTVDELQGRIESLGCELNASKHQKKPGGDASMQSDDTMNMPDADLTTQVSRLTSERDELTTKLERASSELSLLQSTFATVKAERDAAEARARELLLGKNHTEEVMEALNSEKEVLIQKIEECIARLYSEKDESSEADRLNAELQGKRPADTTNFEMNGGNDPSSPMENLEKQLREKDAEVTKLIQDKEKLEAYTKQTLQIFQQKYFATSTDYKAQLKEKTDKIQSLEAELANRSEVDPVDPLLSPLPYKPI